MGEEPPRIESWPGRLVAFVRHNATRMAVDVIATFAWIVLTTTAFAWFELPTWLLYLVLFTGVVVYTRVTPSWERPPPRSG